MIDDHAWGRPAIASSRVEEYKRASQLFRIHDCPQSDAERGCFPVTADDAAKWNFDNWGIFHAVQSFPARTRRIVDCNRIRAIAIDIDEGDKDEQYLRLTNGPLLPSLVVETNGGFHAYWFIQDLPIEAYRVVVEPVVEFYQADRNAKDVARILRTPGYLHQKNPDRPFPVVARSERGGLYRVASFVRRFPPTRAMVKRKIEHEAQREEYTGCESSFSAFWDNLYHANQMPLLEALSGRACVNGEHFSFADQRNGKYHVLVDGKKHNVWIDIHGRIGSVSGGGPTVVQWIAWYGVPKRESARIVIDLFPELKGQ